MPIQYIKGNLLEWPEGITAIVSGSNSFGAAGAGLARQIAAKYPDAVAEYTQWCESASGGRADLGTFLVTPVDDNTRRIVFLVTQRDVGTDCRQLNYEALYFGLDHLKMLLEAAHAEGRKFVLGIPKWIGCGLAGGDSKIVQAIVEALFGASPVRCVVVEYTR